MSPFNNDIPTEKLSYAEKEKLKSDTGQFRGWLIDAISELRNAISITNKFGCDAFRAAHLKDPNNPDSGVTWETPAGKISSHGKWGALTALLMLIIVGMFFWNRNQATTNADAAVIKRAELEIVVHQILRETKETKKIVNEEKEATK